MVPLRLSSPFRTAHYFGEGSVTYTDAYSSRTRDKCIQDYSLFLLLLKLYLNTVLFHSYVHKTNHGIFQSAVCLTIYLQVY